MKPTQLIPLAVLVGVVIMACAEIVAQVTGQSMGMLTRDLRVLSIDAGGDLPAYAGAVSTTTVMVWAAGGATVLLAAALHPVRRAWLIAFGLLLLVLAVDDAFMLHETVGPSLDIPPGAFYLVYAATAAGLLFVSVRQYRDGGTAALLIGGAFLGFSIVIDLFVEDQFLIEDGFKLVGALVLLTIGPLSAFAAHSATALAELHDVAERSATADASDGAA